MLTTFGVWKKLLDCCLDIREERVQDCGRMGTRDRDYMKRPTDDDGKNGSSSGSKAPELVRRFFKKYPRFPLPLCIVIGILIVIALIISSFSTASH